MAPTHAALILFQQDLEANLNNMEELMKENKMFDKKLEGIKKQKKENLVKVSGHIHNVKKMRIEDYEATEEDGRDDIPGEASEDFEEIVEEERNVVESPQEEVVILAGDQLRSDEGSNVRLADLKREEKTLLQNIKESTKNLSDHKKMLISMEKENGHDEDWQAQLSDVKKFTVRHEKYKEATLRRIDAIRKEVQLLKKVVKEKIVVNEGASSASDIGPSTSSSSRFAAKRKLNESVLDCGEIVKKIPTKEREAMVPIVLKVEEPPCEYPYECSFSGCGRFFTSAASLASHLGKHYPANQAKFDCPFPNCQFTNTQEHLTKHMRSKHTKEQIFNCEQCSSKFHTMEAKVAHEKKHNQQHVWGQCDKEDCLRFYKLAKGHRSCPKN